MRLRYLLFAWLMLSSHVYAQSGSMEQEPATELVETSQKVKGGESDPDTRDMRFKNTVETHQPAIEHTEPSTAVERVTEAAESLPQDPRIIGDLGLEIVLGTGLNLCLPRGEANCQDLLPGPYYTLGFQYRFWRMGIALSYAKGMHIPIGTGAENVTVRTDHLIMDLNGYFPKAGPFEPFAGIGLGYGNLTARDTGSNSRVEWSTFWQTVRLSGGIRGALPANWLPGNGWIWETYGALYLHQGGERCVFYAAQGACWATDERSGGDIDYASTLELGGRLGYSF